MVILRSLQSTDEMLVHLQSFSSNPSYYTIPESAKNGVPLFYLPPNSNNPVSVVKRLLNLLVNIQKIVYLKCGERYEDMIDHRSYAQLKQL